MKLAVASLILVGAASAAQAEETAQLWVTPSVAKSLDRSTTLQLEVSGRLRSEGDGGDLVQARLGIDRALGSGFAVGVGVYAVESQQDERRLQQQVTFSRGIFRARTRLEQRFFEGAPRTAWRLRQRIGFEVPVKGRRWSVLASVEPFWTLRDSIPGGPTGLTTFRLTASVERKLGAHASLSVAYLNQRTIVRDGPDRVAHIPQIGLAFRY